MPPFFLPPPQLHPVRRAASPQMTLPLHPPAEPVWPPPDIPPATLPAKHACSYYAIRRPRAPFFEGWYLRVVLPQSSASFAFMFSIEAPSRGTIQLLTPSDTLHVRELDGGRFVGDRTAFCVGHWGYASCERERLRRLYARDEALQGYQLSGTASHGRFRSSARGSGAGLVQWAMEYTPLLTWGSRGTSRHTASWLSEMQLFEPGYQVLMAHGVATGGYIVVDGARVDVTGGVVYAEKNWGRSFPRRWWWVQANAFWQVRDLSVLALGARRKVLAGEETVGIVAIHYEGELFEFANWNCELLEWRVDKWGFWKCWSTARTGHVVEIEAMANERPVPVLGPSEEGMVYNIRDCARGRLRVTLKDAEGVVILDEVSCENAQVEVGGQWDDDWKATVNPMPWPLRGLVNKFNGPKVCTTP